MKFTRPDDQAYLKALIYGPNGHGKTHFLGTAQDDPRTFPMLLLNFEGGTKTLVGLDIDIATITSWQDYNEVYSALVKGNLQSELFPGEPIRSIGIDSISETHVFALLSLLEAEKAGRKDQDLLEMRDYGRASIQLRRLLRHFRDLPMHVFFTALSKDDVEPRVGTIKKPALSGQMAEEVPGMMDVVGYLALTQDEEGKSVRALILGGEAKFRTKARSSWGVAAPDLIEPDPTVSMLMDALGYQKKEDAVA